MHKIKKLFNFTLATITIVMKNHNETTIHDIARQLNLSASTVSRALNNNPLISEATRRLIRQKADEMGYRPNIVASNFRTKKTNTIGVIVPLINRHFFSSVISGIEEVAYMNGFAVTISQSNDNFQKETKIAQTLFANRADGVIISIGMQTTSFDHLKVFSERGIPLVFFDRVVDEIKAYKIVVDDFNGGYMATKHLIDQGAKTIAHIGGPLHLDIYRSRHAGYKAALEESQLQVDRDLMIHNSLTYDEGIKSVEKLMEGPLKPDAIFCANDTTALSAIMHLQKLGFKIPQQIKIVGFSNEPFSEVVTPSISTIEQPGFEMGKKAAELLINQILGLGEKSEYETLLMPIRLIARESSGK